MTFNAELVVVHAFLYIFCQKKKSLRLLSRVPQPLQKENRAWKTGHSDSIINEHCYWVHQGMSIMYCEEELQGLVCASLHINNEKSVIWLYVCNAPHLTTKIVSLWEKNYQEVQSIVQVPSHSGQEGGETMRKEGGHIIVFSLTLKWKVYYWVYQKNISSVAAVLQQCPWAHRLVVVN